ncbi:MAG TPA: GNAT family N-acetyltransferase [Cellvibrio sp.]|nr:GNAT family N-acetyltransferase [Cellvibrio sp.]
MEIRLAEKSNLELFFQYLDIHLHDNGSNETPVFQPLSRKDSIVSDEVKNKFLTGVNKTVGEDGWRTLMLAFIDQTIIGHIDIRSHPNKSSSHRALLGMGVDAMHRGKGVGEQLLKFLLEWMRVNTVFEYLDLQVMSGNVAAISLYKKMGFTTCGEIRDLYRIDGKSVSETLMLLRLR